jgi:hypothetical protein
MAKPLRDISPKKPKEGDFSGKRSSTREKMDIANLNASPGNQDFAKKHEIEKHNYPYDADAAFTGGKVKPAPYNKQDQKVYEAKSMKCEACGSMYEGDSCGCGGKSVPEAKPGKKGMIADKKKLYEVLTKKTKAGEVVSDFVHSDNPKFSGKSKKERIKMALGAYYGMHPEKSKKVNEDLAMPMLEGGKKKKKEKESAPGDTPIRYTSGIADDPGRI